MQQQPWDHRLLGQGHPPPHSIDRCWLGSGRPICLIQGSGYRHFRPKITLVHLVPTQPILPPDAVKSKKKRSMFGLNIVCPDTSVSR